MASAQGWQAMRLHLLAELDVQTLKQAIVGIRSSAIGDENAGRVPEPLDFVFLASLLAIRGAAAAATGLLAQTRNRRARHALVARRR